MPPRPAGVTIEDPDSLLSDQYALIWAPTEFKTLTESEETREYYQGNPFPTQVNALATGLAMAIFRNIQSRHWDAEAGTLIDQNFSGELMGRTVTTANVARAVNGLANFYRAFRGSPPSGESVEMIVGQADFLLQVQRADASFPNSYDLAAGRAAPGATTLVTQAEAISALLIAHQIAAADAYKNAALQAFEWMLDNLWDEENEVYRNEPDAVIYTYTPWEIGAVHAATRLLLVEGDELAGHRLRRFWFRLVDQAGMLQAELSQTLETVGDGEPDSDFDHIPDPGLASAIPAAPHGIDAVLAGVVQFDPVSATWFIVDRTYRTEEQMYAANQMYLTGVAQFQPGMVDALELLAINPVHKKTLVSLDDALQQHADLIAALN
jgi:hypothetical protein